MNRINIQDQFLNQVRKEKMPVTVELISGSRLDGIRVLSFDNFSILMDPPGKENAPVLIYKHAIALIRPEGDGRRFRFSGTSEGFKNPPRFVDRDQGGDSSTES